MTILIVIILAIATGLAAVWLLRKKAASAPRVVTLYTCNGYPQSSQVAPLSHYVPELGRAPRTLVEAAMAGWHLSIEAALAIAPVVAPPPFGGEAPTPAAPQVWRITGAVSGDTLVPGTWSAITPDNWYIEGGYTGAGSSPVPLPNPSESLMPKSSIVIVDSRRDARGLMRSADTDAKIVEIAKRRGSANG